MAIVFSAITGWFAARLSQKGQAVEKSHKVLYYQSPMHPWVKSPKPGSCTVCGMSLVPIYEGEKISIVRLMMSSCYQKAVQA